MADGGRAMETTEPTPGPANTDWLRGLDGIPLSIYLGASNSLLFYCNKPSTENEPFLLVDKKKRQGLLGALLYGAGGCSKDIIALKAKGRIDGLDFGGLTV